MTFSEQLTTFFTTVRGLRYGNVVRPSRDWFLLLGMALILALASILWNVWTFDQIASGEILGTPSEMSHAPTNDAFERVKKQFDARTTEANKYLFEYHFIDPSQE